jgi:hypothetical protein
MFAAGRHPFLLMPASAAQIYIDRAEPLNLRPAIITSPDVFSDASLLEGDTTALNRATSRFM